jgi:two-component sensor histidine kinase
VRGYFGRAVVRAADDKAVSQQYFRQGTHADAAHPNKMHMLYACRQWYRLHSLHHPIKNNLTHYTSYRRINAKMILDIFRVIIYKLMSVDRACQREF